MEEEVTYSKSGGRIYKYKSSRQDIQDPYKNVNYEHLYYENIEKHIEKFIGKIDSVYHEIISEYVHIDIFIVAPNEKNDFYTLITCGMSDKPMNIPEGADEFKYAELVICLPKNWKIGNDEKCKENNFYWPLAKMRYLAKFPHEYNNWLCYSHTIPNGNPTEPYSDNTELNCMLLLTPILFDTQFGILKINDEININFYSLIPIYEEETKFKLEKGVDALIAKFNKHKVNELLELNRINTCKNKNIISILKNIFKY